MLINNMLCKVNLNNDVLLIFFFLFQKYASGNRIQFSKIYNMENLPRNKMFLWTLMGKWEREEIIIQLLHERSGYKRNRL